MANKRKPGNYCLEEISTLCDEGKHFEFKSSNIPPRLPAPCSVHCLAVSLFRPSVGGCVRATPPRHLTHPALPRSECRSVGVSVGSQFAARLAWSAAAPALNNLEELEEP